MPRLHRLVTAVVLGVAATFALAGCGAGSSSAASTSQPLVVDITINGDQTTPNGSLVKASVGQPISFHVTADAAGEIHVHSSPEQEFQYGAGTTTLKLAPITAPGVITVESHTLEKVLFKLQVR